MMQFLPSGFPRIFSSLIPKILIVLTLSVAAGFAETILFTGLPVNTAYGTFNGFAVATVNGIPNQLLVCDDYNHTTYVPSGPLTYAVSTLTGPNPLQFARFANPNQLTQSIARYEEAAMLVDGLLHTGSNFHHDLTADYQYALWHLLTPSVSLPSNMSEVLLKQAGNDAEHDNASDLDIYARLRIYTPIGPDVSNQEFLAFVAAPDVPTPEPSGATLAAIGMVLLLTGAMPRWLRAFRGRERKRLTY